MKVLGSGIAFCVSLQSIVMALATVLPPNPKLYTLEP